MVFNLDQRIWVFLFYSEWQVIQFKKKAKFVQVPFKMLKDGFSLVMLERETL